MLTPIIIVLSVLLIGMFLILYSNLVIRFGFRKHNKDNSIIVSITGLYGIFKYTKRISNIDLVKVGRNISALKTSTRTMVDKEDKLIDHDESTHSIYDVKEIIDNYRDIYIKYGPPIKKVKEKLVFNNISWYTEVGTEDAAETAVIVGALWAIKASVISLVVENYDFSDVSINIVPNYNVSTFETTINCIFSVKLGYIINADIRALLAQIKDGVKNE